MAKRAGDVLEIGGVEVFANSGSQAACKVANVSNIASHEVIEVPNCLRSVSPLTGENGLERFETYEQMNRAIGSGDV